MPRRSVSASKVTAEKSGKNVEEEEEEAAEPIEEDSKVEIGREDEEDAAVKPEGDNDEMVATGEEEYANKKELPARRTRRSLVVKKAISNGRKSLGSIVHVTDSTSASEASESEAEAKCDSKLGASKLIAKLGRKRRKRLGESRF